MRNERGINFVNVFSLQLGASVCAQDFSQLLIRRKSFRWYFGPSFFQSEYWSRAQSCHDSQQTIEVVQFEEFLGMKLVNWRFRGWLHSLLQRTSNGTWLKLLFSAQLPSGWSLKCVG